MSKAKMLVAPPPVVIDDTNLSRAWSRLLLQVLDGAGTEVALERHHHVEVIGRGNAYGRAAIDGRAA